MATMRHLCASTDKPLGIVATPSPWQQWGPLVHPLTNFWILFPPRHHGNKRPPCAPTDTLLGIVPIPSPWQQQVLIMHSLSYPNDALVVTPCHHSNTKDPLLPTDPFLGSIVTSVTRSMSLWQQQSGWLFVAKLMTVLQCFTTKQSILCLKPLSLSHVQQSFCDFTTANHDVDN